MTTLNNNELKIPAIKRLYDTSRAAKAAFDYFAGCTNNKRETTVDRLHAVLVNRGHNIAYAEVRDFLRELVRLNCGTYRIGRRGWPSRLQWNVGLVSLGQVASGQRSEVEALRGDEAAEEVGDTESATNGAADLDELKVSYPLRRDRHVEIVLPKDITPVEAQRLAEFIKTLQFE